MRKGSVFLALAAIALPGFAQTPTARAGHSVTTRIAVRGAWLGVGLGEVTPERAKALKMKDEKGIEITHVEDNSPAAKAGLKESDVVLEINGQKVDGSEEFVRTIAESTPRLEGEPADLAEWRQAEYFRNPRRCAPRLSSATQTVCLPPPLRWRRTLSRPKFWMAAFSRD